MGGEVLLKLQRSLRGFDSAASVLNRPPDLELRLDCCSPWRRTDPGKDSFQMDLEVSHILSSRPEPDERCDRHQEQDDHPISGP